MLFPPEVSYFIASGIVLFCTFMFIRIYHKTRYRFVKIVCFAVLITVLVHFILGMHAFTGSPIFQIIGIFLVSLSLLFVGWFVNIAEHEQVQLGRMSMIGSGLSRCSAKRGQTRINISGSYLGTSRDPQIRLSCKRNGTERDPRWSCNVSSNMKNNCSESRNSSRQNSVLS